ncbi:MAG: hypothetical protein WC288_01070 [Candidatus Paceibacterota bacterium]|jgi:hypothetical protein|nr:hypothetical protein [Candidatus Paceibacterota bacterium]
MVIIPLNHKKIRAEVIKKYLGNKPAFCFSCGNAFYALKKAKVNLVNDGYYDPRHYISPFAAWKKYQAFNATSGHLPLFLMKEISEKIRKETKKFKIKKNTRFFIPFGSGELILAFSFFLSLKRVVALTSKDYSPIELDWISKPLKNFVFANCTEILEIRGIRKIKDLKNFVEKIAEKDDVFIDTSPAERKHN